ncbi:hypothetical protein F7725_006052 [Dissostichus mawsoni]|uniref:Uncharacterized protein n=1 Tax=Dissostichus mawsoni TaxID=36200 RepID=A0A7J5YW17_DISMA|nr:hypothetical protein F7725_006052 [Dissostichus mawsoni]
MASLRFVRTQFDEGLCELLTVDGDATQQVAELMEGNQSVQEVVRTQQNQLLQNVWPRGFEQERKMESSSTRSPVTWQAVASWYIMCRDQSSVEDDQQTVLVVLQQNPEGTERNNNNNNKQEVLEGPLDVLVRCQLAGERWRLLAAHPQDAVVGGQHAAVEQHHLLVVVVGQDVVEGDVLRHHGVLHHQTHVLRTVHALLYQNESRACLLWFVAMAGSENEAVRHEAEVLHQLGGAVHAGVHVQLGAAQQPQQQVVHLVQNHRGVGRQRQLAGRQVQRARGAEHLTERVAGDQGDQELQYYQRAEFLTCADSWVVVRQQEALHPVLHVLQNPAVSQLVPRSLNRQPVQTLGRVVLDHLEEEQTNKHEDRQ